MKPTVIKHFDPTATAATPPAGPGDELRNVYACLVHESAPCVIDLVRNLRHLDQTSRILLYNGGQERTLLDAKLPWSSWGVEIIPAPLIMKWGFLHHFAFDCLRYLKSSPDFDVLTIVDSDQLALRGGYTKFLTKHLGDRSKLGLLSNAPHKQGPKTRILPALTAQQELELWRPYLRRFPDGEDKFVYWTFWPSTVITAEAGFAMLELFDQDADLARILSTTNLWATEEILFPTLAALLGFRIEQNPCSYDYVQYRKAYGPNDIKRALLRPDAFWIHPVPRRYADPLRVRIRAFHDDYPYSYYLSAYRKPSSTEAMAGGSKTTPLGLADIEIPGRLAQPDAPQRFPEFNAAGIRLACLSTFSQLKHWLLGGIAYLILELVLELDNPKLIALVVPGAKAVTASQLIRNRLQLLERKSAIIVRLGRSVKKSFISLR